MVKKINQRFHALLLMFLSFFYGSSLASESGTEMQFGSVAMDIPAIMYERLKPLTKYLGEKLNRTVSLKLSPNMGDAIHQIAEGNVDLAYLTPVAYLNAHRKGNVKLVAKTVTNGKAFFNLMIVVKADSPFQSVSDLVGKSFAFGDKRALLQRATVFNAGLRLEDFSEFKYIGHYDNIARAIVMGDFDAGILKDTMAYKWQRKGLRIIHSSPDLPPYNIAAASHVDDQTLQQLRQAFLDLSQDNPDHFKIIKALDKKYDGFAATSDAEYDVVRELIKPFKK